MMLYHVPERPRAIRDIRRVLTSSGALYATTTGRAYMREVQEDAWRILGVDRRAARRSVRSRDRLRAASRSLLAGRDQALRKLAARDRDTAADGLLPFDEADDLALAGAASALREHFDSIIAQHGEIAIPMDMGMLIARN